VFGSGEIEIGASVSFGTAATEQLNQNLVIENGATLTAPTVTAAGPVFSGGKKITTSGTGVGGTLAFGGIDFTSITIGAEIENEGTISTSVATDTLLAKVLALPIKGAVSATGAINALSAPLVIPTDIDLTLTAGTLATGDFSVSVPAGTSADFQSATFDGVTTASITVGGEAEFGAAIIPAGAVTISSGGEAEFSAAAAPSGTLTINGEAVFSGAAAPTGNVTIGAGAEVTVKDGGGTLIVAATKTLTIGSGAKLTLETGVATQLGTAAGTVISGGSSTIVIAGRSFTYTDTTGLAPTAFATAVTALESSITALTNTSSPLGSTFNKVPTIPAYAVTTVSPGSNNTAVDVATLGTGTTLAASPTTSVHKYSVTTISVPGSAFGIVADKLQLTDTAYNTSAGATSNTIVEVTGLKIVNDLLTVTVPDFNVAITTKR
jgi:hypothetical protein